MIAFLRSTSSFDTFSSTYIYGTVLSWIPSSCNTIVFTCFGYSASSYIIFLLSSSFFFFIFYLCYSKRFFLSSWFSTFGFSSNSSLGSSFFTSSTFSSTTSSFGGIIYSTYFFWVPLKGGRSPSFVDAPMDAPTPIGFSFLVIFGLLSAVLT